MNNVITGIVAFFVGAAVSYAIVGSNKGGESGGVTPEQMADAVHTVLEADRTVYTQKIINRLTQEEQVIKASEHWEDEKALLLPAQMFRAGSEEVQKKGGDFSYSLLSLWPINTQNKPKTDLEKKGLQAVIDNPNMPFYGTEALGDKSFFTAVYADVAVSKACVLCHNNHQDSPKTDFELNDVMGGVVIRIPQDS